MKIQLLDYEVEVGFISIHEPDPRGSLSPLLKVPEKKLMVYLECKEGIGSITGFGVAIPIKDYTEEEFTAAVKEKGEEIVRNMLKNQEEDRLAREARDKEIEADNKFIRLLGEELSVPFNTQDR